MKNKFEKCDEVTLTEYIANRRARAVLGKKHKPNAAERSEKAFWGAITLTLMVGAMAAENKKEAAKKPFLTRVIILLGLYGTTIKAKLGFGISTADTLFLSKSEGVFDGLTADVGGFFIPVFAHLALLGTQNGILDQAIKNIALGIMGAEAAKVTAKKNVMKTLNLALYYINELCANDQLNATEMIKQACMLPIASKSGKKQDLGVKQGKTANSIMVRSLAGRNADGKLVKTTYYWQMSISPITGPMIWVDLDSGFVAFILVTGLASIPTSFRKRTKIRIAKEDVMSAWSAFETITPQ